MKKILLICYWVAAIVTVAAIMLSFRYGPAESFFIGTLFLPGALAAKYAFAKTGSGSRTEKIKAGVFVTAGILVGELLLIYAAHYVISTVRMGLQDFYEWPAIPPVLQNPVFLAVIIVVLVIGSIFVESLLEKRFPSGPETVTFLSDRRPVTLKEQDIMFVESNDTITIVHTTDGNEFRNKTPISQWEAILESGFVRIHRSFLVKRSAITSVEGDVVTLGEMELPVSRKYKPGLKESIR